jgi:hypothetical protein
MTPEEELWQLELENKVLGAWTIGKKGKCQSKKQQIVSEFPDRAGFSLSLGCFFTKMPL